MATRKNADSSSVEPASAQGSHANQVEEETDSAAAVDEQANDTQPAEACPVDNDYRTEPRKALHVKAVVQFKESEDDSWKEVVDITTISKNGAALLLARSCPIGRIVSMALQMPADLRVYDFDKDIYPMLGVVQNCSPISIGENKAFQVGVAFIGKKMPESYRNDPQQSFRIVGRSELGLWDVAETDRAFQSRRASRFWRRFEVSLSVRDEEKRETTRQKALTRDISIGGMSVWGPLDARIGDRVKVTSREHDFYTMAVVRNRTEKETPEESMVHFEFEGKEFPVSKIERPNAPGDSSGENSE